MTPPVSVCGVTLLYLCVILRLVVQATRLRDGETGEGMRRDGRMVMRQRQLSRFSSWTLLLTTSSDTEDNVDVEMMFMRMMLVKVQQM